MSDEIKAASIFLTFFLSLRKTGLEEIVAATTTMANANKKTRKETTKKV